jgi:hypothetical protein
VAHKPLGGFGPQARVLFLPLLGFFTCFEIFLLHIFGLTGQV